MNLEHEDSKRPARELKLRVAVGTLMLLAFVSAAVVLYGCGQSKTESASATQEESTGSLAAVPLAQSSAAVEAVPAVATAAASASDAGGTLPPEIALEAMDTLVVPGQAFTVTVSATPDVNQILLSDGLNDPQAMVRSASGDGTWSVDYRVPLKPREERFGLSVTAKNEAGRWRRLWLFLNVQKPGIEDAASDSLVIEK